MRRKASGTCSDIASTTTELCQRHPSNSTRSTLVAIDIIVVRSTRRQVSRIIMSVSKLRAAEKRATCTLTIHSCARIITIDISH
nr:hypothetical protein CFP56_73753 [Quercus suber]